MLLGLRLGLLLLQLLLLLLQQLLNPWWSALLRRRRNAALLQAAALCHCDAGFMAQHPTAALSSWWYSTCNITG